MPQAKEIKRGTKYRSICDNVQLRAVKDEDGSDKMKFDGYAIVFNQETTLWKDPDTGIEYKEVIDKDALKGADIKDVPMRYNHAVDWVLARTRKKTDEGSLVLEADDFGLKVSGEFVNMQYSRDVYAMMVAGVVNQMSFAFTVRDYAYDRETHTTTIRAIDKLFDVSVVDSPAYPQTSISAQRGAEEAEMEIKAKQEAEALEKAKAEAEAERNSKVEALVRRIKLDSVKEKLN